MTASALAATAVTGIATAAAAAGPAAGATHAAHAAHTGPLKAASDTYSTGATGTLAVTSRHGVLANDSGGDLQLVSHTAPGHGSLTLNPDGSFNYVSQAGFTGDDTFTYTVTNAVHLYSTHLPPLGNFGGVNVTAGGYGSSLYPDPGHPGLFYGLTDRGPNVTAADGNDVEPIPTFDPSIGLSKFEGGHAVLERRIPLRDGSGHPYTGLVNSQNPTGEVIEDLDGHSLA